MQLRGNEHRKRNGDEAIAILYVDCGRHMDGCMWSVYHVEIFRETISSWGNMELDFALSAIWLDDPIPYYFCLVNNLGPDGTFVA